MLLPEIDRRAHSQGSDLLEILHFSIHREIESCRQRRAFVLLEVLGNRHDQSYVDSCENKGFQCQKFM